MQLFLELFFLSFPPSSPLPFHSCAQTCFALLLSYHPFSMFPQTEPTLIFSSRTPWIFFDEISSSIPFLLKSHPLFWFCDGPGRTRFAMSSSASSSSSSSSLPKEKPPPSKSKWEEALNRLFVDVRQGRYVRINGTSSLIFAVIQNCGERQLKNLSNMHDLSSWLLLNLIAPGRFSNSGTPRQAFWNVYAGFKSSTLCSSFPFFLLSTLHFSPILFFSLIFFSRSSTTTSVISHALLLLMRFLRVFSFWVPHYPLLSTLLPLTCSDKLLAIEFEITDGLFVDHWAQASPLLRVSRLILSVHSENSSSNRQQRNRRCKCSVSR